LEKLEGKSLLENLVVDERKINVKRTEYGDLDCIHLS
jgi:hypothetical protein